MMLANQSQLCQNSVAKKLFSLMEEKQSNLAFNPDVTTKAQFLQLVDQVGPFICVLKTHIDIIADFDWDLIEQLQLLAQKHRFLLFEDRKFTDIGNTVFHQYGKGIYRIVEWADIVNATVLPGPAIIEGLQLAAQGFERGVLLLAQMSSSGNLATEEYTQKAIAMAEKKREFVMGFICQQRLSPDPEVFHLTPGVQMAAKGDALGQRYRTPWNAIYEDQNDIIIVGRGIYGADNPADAAQQYQKEGWNAYLRRFSK